LVGDGVDELSELKRMLEANLASDYGELFELLLNHRGTLDAIFVADAIAEALERACADPATYGFDMQDHVKLMAIWGEVRALRESWWEALDPDE
jgi:hypothetical protein